MNLPNVLTLVRFALIPIYLAVFFSGHIISAFWIMVLAGMTDILDGYLARKTGQVTETGIMLDPLADKLMMLAVILSFLLSGMVPWSAAAAIILRDVAMIAGGAIFHFRGLKTVPANTMGKLTTVLYYIAVVFLVFEASFAIPYLWFVIAFSYLTALIYGFKLKIMNNESRRAAKTDGKTNG